MAPSLPTRRRTAVMREYLYLYCHVINHKSTCNYASVLFVPYPLNRSPPLSLPSAPFPSSFVLQAFLPVSCFRFIRHCLRSSFPVSLLPSLLPPIPPSVLLPMPARPLAPPYLFCIPDGIFPLFFTRRWPLLRPLSSPSSDAFSIPTNHHIQHLHAPTSRSGDLPASPSSLAKTSCTGSLQLLVPAYTRPVTTAKPTKAATTKNLAPPLLLPL